MKRNNERGIAMVIALFMVLITSVVGTTLMSVARTETLSTQNYRMMSQARYGAESGIHRSANYLLHSYVPPSDLTPFNVTTSPVTLVAGGAPVVLSSSATKASNYPDNAVKTAYDAAAKGVFDVGDAAVNYRSYATLKSMRRFTDTMSGVAVTLQSWEITGEASITGAHEATVEVMSTVERQSSPLYPYAAFATYNGCGALSLAGGATTDSYDSTHALAANGKPVLANTYGNVGTNGNLTEVGNPTMVNGSLSTPRQGVGNCSSNNVTALQGNLSQVAAGINKLSQEILFPTPDIPAPGSGAVDLKKTGGCPAGPACAPSANGVTFTPSASGGTVNLGDININAQAVVHLNAGIYNVNSLTMNGNSQIVVDSGPVIINVAGVGQNTPITITGQGISNTSSNYNPMNLQFRYAGTGDIKLAGGDETSALFYAPNASAAITGGADLYGAIVVRQLTEAGGAAIHYDRNLANGGMTVGNYMLSAFTWKSY